MCACVRLRPWLGVLALAAGPSIGLAEGEPASPRIPPVAFERHTGLHGGGAEFVVRTGRRTILVSGGAATLFLPGDGAGNRAHAVHVTVAGASPRATAVGLDRQPGVVNYLTGGDRSGWRVHVPIFSQVKIANVYRGIDMVYAGARRPNAQASALEFDFVVRPGGDASRIGLRFKGARARVAPGGDLVLTAGAESVRFRRPVAFQVRRGRRQEVACAFTAAAGHAGFRLGRYDIRRTLVIDPVVEFSTLLPGGAADIAGGVCVDAQGNSYIAGVTASTDFLTSAGAFQRTAPSGGNAFITKLSPAGSLIYSTYLGGSGDDSAAAIRVDSAGCAYVTGGTASTDFPVTPGAPGPVAHGPGPDAFVTKLSADGASVVYSTYLGGVGDDKGTGIALGADGSAYVGGSTASPDFPTVAGSFQTAHADAGCVRSADGGASWTPAANGIDTSTLSVLAMDPTAAGTLYAATQVGVFRSADAGATWAALGSQPPGTVTALAVHPQTPTTLYAGTQSNGLYRSTNSGVTWTSVTYTTVLMPAASITAIAISRQSPASVYIIHNGDFTRSTDNGMTWQLKSYVSPTTALGLHPSLPATVYAISSGILFATTDGATSWSQYGMTQGKVQAFSIAPSDPSVWYLVAVSSVLSPAAMAVSTDSGVHWQTRATGLPAASTVRAIAVDPVNPAVATVGLDVGMYRTVDFGMNWTVAGGGGVAPSVKALVAVPADPPTLVAGVVAGADAFAAKIAPGGTALAFSTLLGGPGDDAGAGVAVDSAGSMVVVGTTLSALFPTTVGALQPVRIGNGTGDAFVTKLSPDGAGLAYSTYLNGSAGSDGVAVAVGHDGTAYVCGSTDSVDFPATPGAAQPVKAGGRDAFIAKLTADGASLAYATLLGGWYDDRCQAIAVDHAGDAFVAGSTCSGDFPATLGAYREALGNSPLYKSADAGVSWAPANRGLGVDWVKAIAMDPQHPATLYAVGGLQVQGVYKTFDGGSTWFPASAGIPPTATLRSIAVDPITPSTLYVAAWTGCYKSTDAGASWTLLKEGLARNPYLNSIAIDAQDRQTVYAADSAGVYKSTDGGLHWASSKSGMPTYPNLAFVATHPAMADRVFAGGYDALYVSVNGAQTWTADTGAKWCYGLAFDPSNPAIVYGAPGTDGGMNKVYKSTNYGSGWSSASFGLPITQYAQAVVLDPVTPSNVYIGTSGGARLYRSVNSGAAWAAPSAGPALDKVVALAIDPSHPATLYAGGSVAKVWDAFAARITPGGTRVTYATFIGGIGDDRGAGIAVDAEGVAVVTGQAASTDFPTTPGAISRTRHGASDVFVTRLPLGPSSTADLAAFDASGSLGQTISITARLTGTEGVALPGRSVTVRVAGYDAGSAVTGADGACAVAFTVPDELGFGDHAVTAEFAGDSCYFPATASATLRVAGIVTGLSTEAVIGRPGASVQLSARLVRPSTGEGLQGQTLGLLVEGTSIGAAATDATGTAVAQYSIPVYPTVSPMAIEAAFAGSAPYNPSAATAALTIDRYATAMSAPDRSGIITNTVALKAFLWRLPGSVFVAGRPVGFKIAGTAVGQAVTDAQGMAMLLWPISAGTATRTITATFAGDAGYAASSAAATLTSRTVSTKVYVVDRTAKVKSYVVLKAYLFLTNNALVVGKPVTVKVDGTPVGTANTNPSGCTQFGYTVPDGAGAGSRVIRGEFAGDPGYMASASNGTLTVTKGNLYIWPYVRSGRAGTAHPLRAYVRSLPDYLVQTDKSLAFSVNGTVIGTAATGADGWVSVVWAIPAGEAVGAHDALAEFAGDASYLPVSATTTFNVVP